MNRITLTVDKTYTCDVLVCGGGVSGFAAAVSAARAGAKTILLESGGFLGGTATKGLVAPFMTCYDAKGENRIIRGLYSELEQRLLEMHGAIPAAQCHGGDSFSGYRTKGHMGVMPFDYELIKIAFEQICLESGVTLLYHTTLLDCQHDAQSITRVYASDSNSILSVDAKMFIDTTGSAHLAYKAGAKTMRGNEDGVMQTSTMFFVISGVDKAQLDAYMDTHPEMRERFFMDVLEQGKKDGTFPCGTQKLRIFELPDGNFVVNMAQIDEPINELDGEVITRSEIEQRLQIQKIVAFLKKHVVGLENIRLHSTASDLGIRESRRIVGKTIFTLEDILQCRKFEDRIAVCANSIDIHQKDRVNYIAHSGENYYIPLSCLISENISNLLTAGKSLSADRHAFAAVRVMPPCIAMGEAAGVTAALAAKQGIPAGAVPHEQVQQILLRNGAFLG